jgi:hypothetical protein
MVELPTHLTDAQLLESTRRLAACERTATAALVAHLAEVDARRLAVAAGHSLFTYCRRELLLSEDAACTRITAVRVVRSFPAVLAMLADGRLNLSTVRVLAPHLTVENHGELIAEAEGKSKRSVEELMARRFPQDVKTSIRRVAQPQEAPPPPAAAGAVSLALRVPPEGGSGAAEPTPQPAEPPGGAAPPPPLAGKRAVTPMAEDVFLIRLAAGRAMVERLRHAQDLLGRAVPRGDVTEVFDRALVALIEDLEKKRFGGVRTGGRDARRAVGRPPAARPPARESRGRHISAEVRRVVWDRDGGRCAYRSAEGHRCEATRFLELHHLRPFEVGGAATVENIALRCRAHNQYEADVYFAPFRQAMAIRDTVSARDSIRPGTDGRSAARAGSGAPAPAG